jgi:hypothetical protein
MSAKTVLRAAAAALLVWLAAIPAASAGHRAGHGGPFYGKSGVRMHAVHRGGVMRPVLHRRHHGIHHGGHHGIGHRHYGHRHGFHVRHHARPAFFPHHRHDFHHRRFHGAYGYLPRKRFFPVHGHGHRHVYGHGIEFGAGRGYGAPRYGAPAYDPYGDGVSRYGLSYGSYPTLAYGTVAGAAPYGPLYNRPACVCY